MFQALTCYCAWLRKNISFRSDRQFLDCLSPMFHPQFYHLCVVPYEPYIVLSKDTQYGCKRTITLNQKTNKKVPYKEECHTRGQFLLNYLQPVNKVCLKEKSNTRTHQPLHSMKNDDQWNLSDDMHWPGCSWRSAWNKTRPSVVCNRARVVVD